MIAWFINRRAAQVRAAHLAQVREDLRLEREAEARRVTVNRLKRADALDLALA